jgi:hypothetical protein
MNWAIPCAPAEETAPGSKPDSAAGITCDNATGTPSSDPTNNWDVTKTVTDVEAPATITCTIPIDP